MIDLMNKVFDKVTGDAAAHAAAQLADAAAQRAEMQAEMSRREREAADKARLQLENELLREKIAAAEKRQTDMQLLSSPPATAQSDMHADSVTPATTGAPQPALGDTHALMILADSHTQPPLPPTADSVSPFTAGPLVQPTAVTRDTHSFALSAPVSADTQYTALPSLTDHALPPMMPDMTVAAGPPRVPPRTPALTTYSFMYTVGHALPTAYDVDIGRALPTTGSSQFSMMTADRRDSLMPLYTVPSVVPAVTSVVPTAVHTSSLFSSGAYTQAPAGAFITHTSHGPVVSFPLGAYPGWGNAAIPMGYPNPTPALPTPVMGRPTVSMVDPASTPFGTLPSVSSLPLLTDITPTATTAVTNNAVNSVSSKLAPAFRFWRWLHVLLVWQLTPTGRHFRFQPPPRLLFHHLWRQHQLQLSNRAARLRFTRQHQRLQQLLLPRLLCHQSQPRRRQLSRLHLHSLSQRQLHFRCQLLHHPL